MPSAPLEVQPSRGPQPPSGLGWRPEFQPALDGAIAQLLPTGTGGGSNVVDVSDCSDLSVGRVVRDDGEPLVIASDGGERVRVGAKVSPTPVAGDWVVLSDAGDRRTIVTVLPRGACLTRAAADESSREQVLAANIDVVFVVEHLDPPPVAGRVERLLVLAWSSGARPVVVLTKADLAGDAQVLAAQVGTVAPGVEVLVTSGVTGEGLDRLRALVGPADTCVLVGPSGAGKSTLVNALADSAVMAVGERRIDGKGRHTTTHRELVLLPEGGAILDTPGLRAIALAGDEDGLDAAFPDVAELAEQCRFNDCVHVTEPGCAVLAAVDEGALPERRLDAWRRLQRELRWQASRSDHRLRAEDRARWKAIHASQKQFQQNRQDPTRNR